MVRRRGPGAGVHHRRGYREHALRYQAFDAYCGCAALSAHGIHSLILPPNAKRVRIFADHDELGQGFIAAREAWGRWRARGSPTSRSP